MTYIPANNTNEAKIKRRVSLTFNDITILNVPCCRVTQNCVHTFCFRPGFFMELLMSYSVVSSNICNFNKSGSFATYEVN